MYFSKYSSFHQILALTISGLGLVFSSMTWAGDFVSPTRPVLPPVQPEDVDPIYNSHAFNGYICEINTGTQVQSTISVHVYSEPDCTGDFIGFVSMCSTSVGLSCPHEDNPSKYGYLYSPEIKPALIQTLHQAMITGTKVKVYRLSNTFDYPHYEGPLDYGNKIVFTALH